MAILTPALLAALNTGFRSDFEAAFQAAQAASQYQKIATVIPSATASNTYGWLGQFPAFREWIGERVLKDMAASGYQIVNKHYESSVSVKRTDIEDDAVGIYRPLMSEMGRAAAVFPDQIIFNLLAAGGTTPCYDGQNFFDADHPLNLAADGTGTAISVANTAAGTDAAWYLMDTRSALKPLIFQNRKSPEFTLMTRPDDEAVFMTGVYRYGVDTRCNAGFGFWQTAYRSMQPLNAANYGAARAAMSAFRADGLRPLGIVPNLLPVPPSLEGAARTLLLKDTDNGNPWYHSAELLVCPWLKAPADTLPPPPPPPAG
jgi:phage major head subunit gpT-like protein